jgi:hypothetical protein
MALVPYVDGNIAHGGQEPARNLKRLVADSGVLVSDLQAGFEATFISFGSRDLSAYVALAGSATEWRGGRSSAEISKISTLAHNILIYCKNGVAPIKRLELAILACRAGGKVNFTFRTDEDHASREGGSTFIK